MNEYLLIIRGGLEVSSTLSPEEMQAHVQRWQKWMRGLAKDGNFVAGQPLKSEGKSFIKAGKQIIDRPLTEGKELVGGYLILKADSLDEATKLTKECPAFEHNCTIEVREISLLE